MTDFRSQRMPSPEGHGHAKERWQRAWKAYSDTVNKVAEPVLVPLVAPLARTVAFDAMGFWLSWHLDGGYDGLHERLGMSRSAIYRRLALFRAATGKHPDDYEIPGVHIDVGEYLAAMLARKAAEER